MAQSVGSASRLGRPRDSDSALTRQAILAVAREEFSLRGYDVTTNRKIASLVGITSGALYHYFESKLDLYLAVNEDVQTQILDVLTRAVASGGSFVEKFEAILDATLEMNRRDPSVGRFNGVVRVDARRHEDISAALGRRRDLLVDFFAGMIGEAVAAKELSKRDVPVMEAFIRMVLLGITAGLSDDFGFQEQANEAVKRAMHGRLL